MKTLFVLICLAMAVPAAAEELAGQASVIDGDTIEISSTRVRLFGIDAPESDQTCHDDDGKLYRCGQKAADELAGVIGSKTVRCEVRNRDQYGRAIATCTAAGADLGEWMVRRGLALDWPQYSKGRYAAAQKAAERAGNGLWGGQWVEPWRYRLCKAAGGRLSACSESADAR